MALQKFAAAAVILWCNALAVMGARRRCQFPTTKNWEKEPRGQSFVSLAWIAANLRQSNSPTLAAGAGISKRVAREKLTIRRSSSSNVRVWSFAHLGRMGSSRSGNPSTYRPAFDRFLLREKPVLRNWGKQPGAVTHVPQFTTMAARKSEATIDRSSWMARVESPVMRAMHLTANVSHHEYVQSRRPVRDAPLRIMRLLGIEDSLSTSVLNVALQSRCRNANRNCTDRN